MLRIIKIQNHIYAKNVIQLLYYTIYNSNYK